jgi:hypothetical protein
LRYHPTQLGLQTQSLQVYPQTAAAAAAAAEAALLLQVCLQQQE